MEPVIGEQNCLRMEWIDFDKSKFLPESVIDRWLNDEDPLRKGMATFLFQWFDDSDYITIQSSGTTGSVRAFNVLKEHMVQSAKMTSSFFGYKKGDTALLCLSMNFIAGKMMVVRAIVSELKLGIASLDSNPLKSLDQGIDFCPMVPMQVANSLDKIHLIKKLLIGGAGLNSRLETQINNIHTECYMSFGMAETLSHIAIRKLDQKGHLFKILDQVSIDRNEEGCLRIEAPEIGVRNLETKDLVEIVGDRHFRWLGRKDNLINSGGVKVIPESIEEKFKDLLPDCEYFIGGIQDDRLGEKVVLCVECSSIKNIQKKITRNHLLELGLTNYQIPKTLFIIRQFERTESEKIKRKYILENIRKQEIIYQVDL